MLATGVSGNAAQAGLAFARLCMPNESAPPKKVVISFRPNGVFVAITHYADYGELSRQMLTLATTHYELRGPQLLEILHDVFGSKDFQYTERMDLVIEASKIAKVHSVQVLKEDDQFLAGALDLAQDLGEYEVVSFTPGADE